MLLIDPTHRVIPQGETILVTGVNGFLGSHIADRLLADGYRVRGVVRDLAKSRWIQQHFDEQYAPGSFELIEVIDPATENAFDAAVRDVSGIAHVAMILPVPMEPAPYIETVAKMTIGMLESASKEPKMKSIAVTSSSMAAANPAPNARRTITVDTWNEKALKEAWNEPYLDANMWNVYAASKANAERKAWEWMRSRAPNFRLNTILPNTNFGPTINKKNQGFGSTGKMVKAFYDGKAEAVAGDPPQYFVDVRDTARLHVIALTAPDVVGERLFAFAAPYNWNKIRDVLQQQYPESKLPDENPELGHDIGKYPNERAQLLLQRYTGRTWLSLEESISDSELHIE